MKLQRSLSSVALLFTAVGGIVGSGWLFGPYYVAQIAGPAAVLAWIVGGILMMFVALTFAELSTMYPVAGGMVHFGRLSHGSLLAYCIGWMVWLNSGTNLICFRTHAGQFAFMWKANWRA